MAVNARALTLSLLCEKEEKNGFANLLLSDTVLEKAGDDASFLTALFYGCAERRLTLDYLAAHFAARPVEEISTPVRFALHIGLYQIFFMKTPPHAAVSETVSLLKNKSERGFLNAVLRAAARAEEMPLPPPSRTARYLSVKYSFPLPTVKRFLELYGREDTEKMLTYFNTPLPLTLRARDAEAKTMLLSRFEGEGIRAESTAHAENSVRVLSSVSPKALYGFAEGLFFVQDESSSVVSEALGAKKGDTVIDVCASPGGKTFGAALSVNGVGSFYAFDLYEGRVSLMKDGARRLSLAVDARVLDATEGDESLDGQADRVICDVPCSGLGVLGKKPDLRYRELDLDLPPLQYKILSRASRYVKTGGVLVYSTCTLLPEENEENVRKFLSEHPDFILEDFSSRGSEPLRSEGGMLTLLPQRDGCDGFFIARLKKIK